MICEFCGKSIKRKDNLKRHIFEKHSEEVFVVHCSYCQRPFVRSSCLKRHLQRKHKVQSDVVGAELKHCKKTKMSSEDLNQSTKPVYVSAHYEDITPTEPVCEYEDISSDEDEFIRMCTEDDDLPSIDTQLLDQLIYSTEDSELQGLVDNLIDNSSLAMPMDVPNDVPLNDANIADMRDTGINDASAVDDAPNAEDASDGNQAGEAMHIAAVDESNDASVIVADAPNVGDASDGNQPEEANYESDSVSVTSDIPQSTTVTSCITLKLVKKTTFYRDGSKDTVRETDIGYSNNVDPTTIDIALIAEEIVREVPEHMATRRVRIVELPPDSTDLN